jgi:hypothetical protein
MLGADPKGLADPDCDDAVNGTCAAGEGGSGGGDDGPPMQGWEGWWFVRTYLQSLGQVGAAGRRDRGRG